MDTEEPARILLVDDDSASLRALSQQLDDILTSFGVLTHTDPAAALDRIESEDVGCVVADADLSELSGTEFLHAVRNRDHRMPCILLTDGSETDPGAALDAGATDAFRKPTVREHTGRLAASIRDAAEAYRSRHRLHEGFEFLDTVLGSLDDIVYVTDTEGTPLYWNEASTRVTGYTSAEAQTLDMLDLFPESEHCTVLAAFDTVLEEGSVTFEADLLTKGGEHIRYEFSSTALRDSEGAVIGVCGTGRNIARRHHYERTLRALHRTTRDLFAATTRTEIASTTVGATEYIIDNPLSTVFLREGDELVPVAATDEARQLVGELPVYGVDEDTPAARTFRTGDAELVESAADIDDGRTRTAGWGALYVSLGEFGVLDLGYQRAADITDTHRQLTDILATNTEAALARHESERAIAQRERMLETLHGTTRNLVQTSDSDEIADIIVADADDILDLTTTAVFLWDDQRGVLRPAAASADSESLFGDLTAVCGSDGAIWRTFVDAETTVVSDATDGEMADGVGVAADGEVTARSQLFVPIDGYGVLLSGSPEAAAFDETVVEFAELLAANAATAFDRAEREQTLEEKDRELETKNEELRRINRLNAIIRTINDGLIQAESRAEVLETVCETLTDVTHYRFSWVGRELPAGDTFTPLAFAGEGQSVLDHILDHQADGETSLPELAQSQQEPIVINDIHRDKRVAPWRKAALNQGFRSLVCLPLRCDRQQFGCLEIYADQPGVFTDEEVTVLSELAAQIANAIHAVERKEAILTGRETQLEFEFTDADDPLSELARRTDATLTVDGLVPHRTNSWVVYATVHGSDATTLVEAADALTAITDTDVLRTDDEAVLVSVTVADLSVVNAVATQNATVRTFRVGPTGGRLSVTVPPSTDVRSFIESCQERLPDLQLIRRQTVASESAGSRLKYDLTDLLTAKQLETLQTAYFKGYFEWPRDATGVDVSEALDVSPPTFQQHLRKALQRIFERTFEVRGE